VNEHVDEEIGALLDGRLDEPRRSELLARLATADEDYDVFADTASVLQEAEGGGFEEVPASDRQEEEEETSRSAPVSPLRAEDEASEEVAAVERVAETARSAPVIPLRPRRATGWRSPAVRALAAAAMLAAIALVPVLRSRSTAWRDPARLAVLASPAGARLTDWSHAWNTTRGGGGDSVPNSGVAAQVGALHLDLEVVARSPGQIDSATVKQLANQAAYTLENAAEAGPSLAAPSYRDIVQLASWSRPQVLKQIAAARVGVLPFVDPDYFAVGAWTEAALLAEHRRDAAFFRTRESRKALEQAAKMVGLTRSAREAVTNLRALQDREEIKDWDSIQLNLEMLQRELAR
jgi:hypothetical protein